jgi:hypothetical protein
VDLKTLLPLIIGLIMIAALFAGCTTTPQPGVTTPARTTTAIQTTIQQTATPSKLVYSQAEADLRLQMRKLWTDHVFYTRLYIISALDGSPDTPVVAGRLLKNQEDIGNAIRPIYGDVAADNLTTLLKQHILIAVDIVDAVKTSNGTKQAEAEQRWQNNADDIVALLSGANPNWPAPVLKDLMYMHLATTKSELVARATGNWTADVAAYDAVYNHILTMSDALSGGIVQQFPDKFAGPKVMGVDELALRNGMRKLWTDHTEYTRLYIISALAGSPDTPVVAGRLLKNQEDIGNAIRPIYGDAAADNLTALLKQHILIAVDIVDAVKTSNGTKQAEAEQRWQGNADDIVALLSGANPNWPAPVLKDLMYMHLATTKSELVAHATGNWTADIAAYDAVYNHILTMSDALSNGIVAQFPGKFGK